MFTLKASLFHTGIALAAATSVAHAQVGPAKEHLRFAEAAATSALNFQQGDHSSLVDAKLKFSQHAWNEFMKRLLGSLDAAGAPTFSSTFTPSGAALGVKQEAGGFTLTIPGVLKHESRNAAGGVSTTVYRAEVDLRVSNNPLKVEALSQRTCGGAATKPSCR